MTANTEIANAVGMPEYRFYALQRMTITEGAKRLSVGHPITSLMMVKSYLSRRNVVDIQRLVQNGKEQKQWIMLHSLHQVKQIPQQPSSLSASNVAIEQMPNIQRLSHEHQQTVNALKQALAQS